MKIQLLGDQAVLVSMPDEAAAVQLAIAIRAANPGWLHDVVPAYSRVGVYFDADRTRMVHVIEWMNDLKIEGKTILPTRSHEIPVCYELNLDLERVAQATGLTTERVIELHTTNEYTVYAIGFVPGFPYLGYLPKELSGVPRLATPRVRVEPGSVGLTGKQTGIYPLARPGGWNIVGRTPRVIVDVADGFFPLRVGDSVRFERIDEGEYRRQLGTRL